MSSQIAEDLNLNYPSAPKQEVVFTGVYKKDPLLFFHKDLTLKQITLKTTRYSAEYIRKVARKVTLIVISILFFVIGVTYCILDKSQFAVINGENLQTFKGKYHFEFLGFPKLLWTLDVSPNDLNANSILRKKQPLIAELGKDIMPEVISNCIESKKVEIYTSTGDTQDARSVATKALLSNDPKLADKKSDILKWFKFIQIPTDSVALIKVFESPSSTISDKRAVLACLARLDLKLAMTYSLLWKVNVIEDFYTQREIMVNILPSSRKYVPEYLGKLLTGNFAANIIPLIFETAMVYDVRLRDEDILKLISGVQYSDGVGLGYLMRLHDYRALQKELEKQLNEIYDQIQKDERPNLDALNFILTALNSQGKPVNSCDELLMIADKLYDNEAMALLLSQCPDVRPILNQDTSYLLKRFERVPHVILELSKYGLVNYDFILRTYNLLPTPYHREILINAMGNLGDSKAITLLYSLIPYSETDILPSVRVAAVKALKKLNVKYGTNVINIPSDWEDVIVEVLKWQAMTEKEVVCKNIIDLMEQKDKQRIIIDVLSTIGADEAVLESARNGLNKNGDVRTTAQSVLAMFGNRNDFSKLINDKDLDTRRNAAKYVTFNADFPSLIREYGQRENKWPNEQLLLLKQELSIIDEYKLLKRKLHPSTNDEQWLSYIIAEKYKDYITDGSTYLIYHN